MENKERNNGANNSAKNIAVSVLVAGLQSGKVLAARGIYNSCFPRYEKKDIAFYVIYI